MGKKDRKRKVLGDSVGGELGEGWHTIGELVKFKKAGGSKKGKVLLVDSGGGNPGDDEEADPGEMLDTLATFRKKLKGPKRAKSDVEVGCAGVKDLSESDVVDEAKKSEDARVDDGEGVREEKMEYKISGDFEVDDEDRGDPRVCDSSDQSLELCMDDSLSSFFKKIGSGSARRLRMGGKRTTPESTSIHDVNDLDLSDVGRPTLLDDNLQLSDREHDTHANRSHQELLIGEFGERKEMSNATDDHIIEDSGHVLLEDRQIMACENTHSSDVQKLSPLITNSGGSPENPSLLHLVAVECQTLCEHSVSDQNAELTLEKSAPLLFEADISDCVKATKPDLVRENKTQFDETSKQMFVDNLPNQVDCDKASMEHDSKKLLMGVMLSTSDQVLPEVTCEARVSPCSINVKVNSFESTHLVDQDAYYKTTSEEFGKDVEMGNQINVFSTEEASPPRKLDEEVSMVSNDNGLVESCYEPSSGTNVMAALNVELKETLGKASVDLENTNPMISLNIVTQNKPSQSLSKNLSENSPSNQKDSSESSSSDELHQSVDAKKREDIAPSSLFLLNCGQKEGGSLTFSACSVQTERGIIKSDDEEGVVDKSQRQLMEEISSVKHSNAKEPCPMTSEDPKTIKAPASPEPLLSQKEGPHADALVASHHGTGGNHSMTSRMNRNVKRRKHDDMAYEGDIDWENLMHEQGLFVSTSGFNGDSSSRKKDKPCPGLTNEATNGATAAVAVGLKAGAVTPIEKIKFKEVLKRRGGLQEYLDCRNLILSHWSKDKKRILQLASCGVSVTPLKDEPGRESLIRDIYNFLDRYGFINTGVASSKGNREPCGILPSEIAEEQEKKAFGFEKDKSKDQISQASDQNGILKDAMLNERYIVSEIVKTVENFESEHHESNSTRDMFEPTMSEQVQKHALLDVTKDLQAAVLETKAEEPYITFIDKDVEHANSDFNIGSGTLRNSINNEVSLIPSACNFDCGPDAVGSLSSLDSTLLHQEENREKTNACDTENSIVQPVALQSVVTSNCEFLAVAQKRIVVIGAGPAGLTAARHLQHQGFSVVVLEARNRIGGRVHTDRSSLSVPVDLGASIITGVEADITTERRPDPSSLVCSQLGLELTVLNSDCPLYDIVTGQKVPADLDEALEAEYNSLLDDMVPFVEQNVESAIRMSLEDGLEYALRERRVAHVPSTTMTHGQFDIPFDSGKPDAFVSFSASINNDGAEDHSDMNKLNPLERRVMDWHFANLEYGCAAPLKDVSLPYWNQDDLYGGFGGAHCMIKGGYSTIVESLGHGLDIHLNQVVAEVKYDFNETSGECKKKVRVTTSSGAEYAGDAVLITVPLGCLKARAIQFSPALPEWKETSIQRLGFGVLNKVVLEFSKVFWDDTVDYFGATSEETSRRGQCFMFWNLTKTVGAPVLIALVVGKAAREGQTVSKSDHVNYAVMVLRKLFGETAVPDPVASVVTNWGMDPYSRGAYSYVAVGASGEDYDILGRPVADCLFFAGEATCKEHPDTVGGAMISGLREAVRIIDILTTGKDYLAEVEAIEHVERQSNDERNEVLDISERLDALNPTSVLCRSSSNDAKTLPAKEVLLRDMFFGAKTTLGRLHLAKELLRLPAESLKSFAGTKDGLTTLNNWILDSLGKNATQLLRHCVRLLVLVSTDLLAVRLSGIGRTVKEKVCMHTSRDIRSIASQLVSVWIEVFRKEKARLKLLRHARALEQSKIRLKDPMLGKPSLRTSTETSENKISHHKKSENRTNKLEGTIEGKENNSLLNSEKLEAAEPKVEEDIEMSEEAAAAFAAAEAAQAAALKAAEAYATEAKANAIRDLPKIPSFHKFARREHYAQLDEFDARRKWSGVLGRQDCASDIDSRNCRVRDWTVDFTATYANIDGSKNSGDNYSHCSFSNEKACPSSLKEHSGESGAIDSRLTKAWADTDTAGSGVVKDSIAIERWQSQAMDADADFYRNLRIKDGHDSNKVISQRHESSIGVSVASQVAENKSLFEEQSRGVKHIKQAVVDYVTTLLMPLYKARKIDREGYKSIMKKAATKVMEQCSEAEKLMPICDFLDFRRKNKIRAFVDRLIEGHISSNRVKP